MINDHVLKVWYIMESEFLIPLKANRKDFEEIFYGDPRSSYFRSAQTKKPFKNLIVSSVILGFLLYFITNVAVIILSIFTLLITLVYLAQYLLGLWEVRKIRKQIELYINNSEQIKNPQLHISASNFKFKQESETTTEDWNDFIEFTQNEIFIHLTSNKENYIIPRNSMSDSNWNILLNTLNEKINIPQRSYEKR